MIKRLLGYDVESGLSAEQYEEWLRDIHVPDLFANPFLERIVFNTVTTVLEGSTSFYRIAELHFPDEQTHRAFVEWRRAHPVPLERSPQGRTALRFYVLADSRTVERSDVE